MARAQAGSTGRGTGGQKPQGKLTYTPKPVGGFSAITLDKYKQGQQKRNQAASRGKAQAKRAAAKKSGR
jgi:hypothetical protein